jgi:beta-glucosidase
VQKKTLATVSIVLASALLLFPLTGSSQGPHLPSPAAPAAADSARDRANQLLAQMTVDEKAGQLNQGAGVGFAGVITKASDDSISKGEVGSILWIIDVKEINRMQHVAVEKSRLHIPMIFGYDVIHGYRTTFPVPLAMASSWDPSVEEQAQHVAAEDSRAAGIDWTFAPMLDIARDARWGRIVEGAGEDPYLGAAMARAQVKGFQGAELNSTSLLACAKHFAGYGAAEGGRDYDSSYIPEVLLRNIYFPPFHAAVDQGVGTVMAAYMDLNDVPASGNRWLLHDVLREDWGFKGFVVSDAQTVENLVTHGYASDKTDAAYLALNAGLNMDMASYTFIANVPNLVKTGKISQAQLDDAVRPILETKIRMGLFEHPYVDESAVDPTLNRQSSRDLERKLAARSMVLLRNENQVLPLAKSVKSIALIGPLADNIKDIEGGWSVESLFGANTKTHVVSVAEGIKNKLGASLQVNVVSGPALTRTYPSFIDQLLGKQLPPAPTPAETKQAIDSAVAAAQNSDLVIAVMGEASDQSGEGASRATLDLPGIQEQMLEAVAATGKPVALVLLNGRPLDIRWASEHIPAILEAWYPGTVGGDAVADVLFGDVNPGGKLPVTWPRSVGQEPLYYNHNLTHQPEDAPGFTSRYWDLTTKPLYPFGYGLSYSTFRFGNLHLSQSQITPDGNLEVSVDVTNTSKTSGDAVAQIYIHQRSGSASRPVRELKGFQRVTLAAGESRTLKFQLGPAELRFWSPQTKAWAVEPSTFDVWAGQDSTATLHAEFTVKP